MQIQKTGFAPTALALALVLALGACSKSGDDRTAGEKLDTTVAKVEQKADAAIAKAEEKTDQAIVSMKSGTESVTASGTRMLESGTSKVKDAAITASIKTALARDASLSALKVDVDTSAGSVSLHGTAPDATARDRASLLARTVDGVVGVDNQLEIRSN